MPVALLVAVELLHASLTGPRERYQRRPGDHAHQDGAIDESLFS